MGPHFLLTLAAGVLAPAGGEVERLAGTWVLASEAIDGDPTDMAGPRAEWVLRGHRVTDRVGGAELFRTTFRVRPGSDPAALDLLERDGKTVANATIYELAGDRLTIAFFRDPGRSRPKDFKSAPGDDKVVRVYRREKH